MIFEQIEEKYKLFKQKEGDTLLIKIGVVGVLIGWILSMSFLNQLFAWFILLGACIKLFDFVKEAQKKFEKNEQENKTLSEEIQEKYQWFKQKEGDTLLIKIGAVGVLLGLVFSLPLINQIFAWFLLLGFGMKLYEYVSSDKKKTVI